MAAVHFLDVTNRDGVQTARINLSKFGKTMVNLYLGKLGVSQSELGFPFLFHEVPFVRANLALAKAGACAALKLSGWACAVGADRVRYCDTISSDSPARIRERFANLAASAGIALETHCHHDLGIAMANSVANALGTLDAGRD